MFILGDETHDRGKLPWVTFTLIAVNLLVFSAQLRFGDRLTNGYALVPKEVCEFRDLKGRQPVTFKVPHVVAVDRDGDLVVAHRHHTHYIQHFRGPFPVVLTAFTYMFLHGDFFHFLFNMWFLWVFARNVECAMDHGRFFWFYIACGVVAGLAQALTDVKSVIPIVGASGAIAGVMGAYLAIFPFNTIRVVFGGIGLFAGVQKVPAFAVIGFWFLLQYLASAMTMNEDIVGGTAYFCHIGGFVAGFVSVKAMVLYLHYEIARLKAERGEDDEPAGDDGQPALAPLTPEQIDAILDPVDAFKRARQGVFGNAAPEPLKAELVEDTLPGELAEAVTAGSPRRSAAPRPPDLSPPYIPNLPVLNIKKSRLEQ